MAKKMANIEGIPVYNATLDEGAEGMLCVSLVDKPATKSDWVAFAEDTPLQTFAVKDASKHLVHGVVMRADFPLYRRSKSGYEYYMLYSADVIRQMAERYMTEGRGDNVDTMHDGRAVDGVHLVQWYIVDRAKGIAPEGFAEVRDGSLMAEYHITNMDVWERVTKGDFKGFSLTGIFDLAPSAEQERIDDIVKNTNTFSMARKNTLKARLARMLARFGSMTTDKGILSWEGDDEPKVGDHVDIVTEGDDIAAAEDGEYTAEDGRIIVVENGEIVEIREPEAPVAEEEPEAAPEGEPEAEVAAEEEEAPEAEPEGEEEAPVAEEAPEMVSRADFDALAERVAALEDAIAGLLATSEAMRADVEKLSRTPLAPSAHEAHKDIAPSIKEQMRDFFKK